MELYKIPVYYQVPTYIFRGIHTTPKLTSLQELILLDVIDKIRVKKTEMSLEEVLVKYLDIPLDIMYLFENTLEELVSKRLINYTDKRSLTASIETFKLTSDGLDVKTTRKTPQNKKNFESKPLALNYRNELLNFKKLKKEVDVRETPVVLFEENHSSDFLHKILSKNKKEYIVGTNDDTIISSKFDNTKELNYMKTSINVILNQDTNNIYLDGEEQLLSKFLELNLESMDLFSKQDTNINNNFDKERGNIRVFKNKINCKIVITNNETLVEKSEKIIDVSEVGVDLKDYQMIGIDKNNQPFLYKYRVENIKGLEIPLEQFIIDKEQYKLMIGTYVDKVIKELLLIKSVEEYYEKLKLVLCISQEIEHKNIVKTFIIKLNDLSFSYKGKFEILLRAKEELNRYNISDLHKILEKEIKNIYKKLLKDKDKTYEEVTKLSKNSLDKFNISKKDRLNLILEERLKGLKELIWSSLFVTLIRIYTAKNLFSKGVNPFNVA